ncbi:MAG: lactate utilization protein [Anaerotignaceae bacterium]
MATPKEMRNELLAAKIIKGLEKRHMEGYFCKTSADAIKKALELISEGSSITWGGSMTIRDMGLAKTLIGGNYNVFDRDTCTDPEKFQQGMRDAFSMDWFIASANAITEDGIMVNIDGLGNRVAAITFGPKNVLMVVGLNKVTQDVESAVKRARSTASPLNAHRFDIKTPCLADGTCHDCTSNDCICSCIHILRNSKIPNRIKVILVDEELGF